MQAHVVNGAVLRLIDDAKVNLFPPVIQAEFVAIPTGATVDVGDLYDGVAFSAPPAVAPAQKDYEVAIQNMMDDAAAAKGYDDIVSACSYAASANPFQAEGQAFLGWRGNIWQYCYTQLAAVTAGTRTQPTVSDFLAEILAAYPVPV